MKKLNALKVRHNNDKKIFDEMRQMERYSIVPALPESDYTPADSVDGEKYFITLNPNTYLCDIQDGGRFKKARTKDTGVIAYKDRKEPDRYIATYLMPDLTNRALVLFKNNIDSVTKI